MQWYKHDSDASNDAKIKKLLLRTGAVGYAVYFHCLELIAGNISESNITFELEHDAEIIADNLKITGTGDKSGREIVENIMNCIIDLGLFHEQNGHIYCYKMLKRLDLSMTSNPKLRSVITKAKESHDKVMINHDSIMQDEIRLDEMRIDKMRSDDITAKAKCHDKKESAAKAANDIKDIAIIEKPIDKLHQRTIDFICITHERIHGSKCKIDAKEAKAVKEIIKAAKYENHELPEKVIENRLRICIKKMDTATTDYWSSMKFTPSKILNRWNELTPDLPKRDKREIEQQEQDMRLAQKNINDEVKESAEDEIKRKLMERLSR